jgi:hypothetical protein
MSACRLSNFGGHKKLRTRNIRRMPRVRSIRGYDLPSFSSSLCEP